MGSALVPSAGLEPAPPAPEAGALSTELRGLVTAHSVYGRRGSAGNRRQPATDLELDKGRREGRHIARQQLRLLKRSEVPAVRLVGVTNEAI